MGTLSAKTDSRQGAKHKKYWKKIYFGTLHNSTIKETRQPDKICAKGENGKTQLWQKQRRCERQKPRRPRRRDWQNAKFAQKAKKAKSAR